MRGSMKIAGIGAMLAVAALVLTPHIAGAQIPLISTTEQACADKLGKGAAKVAKTRLKEIATCRDADISGKAVGACPNAANLTKIAKAEQKLIDDGTEECESTCSASGLECIADTLCPPLPGIGASELCTAGAANLPFDMRELGFPGAFCEAELGGPLDASPDIPTCTVGVTEDVSANFIDIVYGDTSNASGLTKGAQGCLKKISKTAQKLSSTIYKGVVKCRSNINSGKTLGNPASCTRDDAKLAAKVAKMELKLADAITKCGNASIAELDICLQGPNAVTTTDDAIDCLVPAVREATDSADLAGDRVYAPATLVEAAYPPQPACGDGVRNQGPSSFLLLGEECDLDDDSACPGDCLPPGDVFQCTCGGLEKRQRFLADGFTADLDNGWTGTSHNSGVTDRAGFVTVLSNCDCDEMTGATCTGTSGDPICDVLGKQKPTCSWEPLGATRCETRGSDPDTIDDNDDCYICDEFSTNAGDFCVNESNCTGQCYPIAGGAPTTTCANGQSDCAVGEICRGQCDRSQTCLIIPNGAPLPISSGGTAVCVLTTFRFDINGTHNIVTGEHAVNIQQYSKVHLGVSNTVPCPQCGGFCDGGGFLDKDTCEGTCSVTTGMQCRFDDDCPAEETCTTASPQCPGGFCNLSLICNGGTDSAQPCRISAPTNLFGTTSSDCRPSPAQNISGNGLEINFLPQTSEAVTLPASLACTSPGFELFDCPCPDSGGRKTQPNLCGFSCDAGAEFGIGCGSGAGAINGFPTTCDVGANAGAACDEDSDCPGGTCSANPLHCDGTDPAFERFPCTSNAQCGTGNCVDACPSGRCVPLCLPADNAFFPPGFGGGSADDPEEGLCAAGPPTYHCSGAADTFRVCAKAQAESDCVATCSISNAPCDPLNPCADPIVDGTCVSVAKICSNSNTPCTTDVDCGVGTCTRPGCELAQVCEAGIDGQLGNTDDFPGSGICIADARNCNLLPLVAEGGDTLNGNGDPTNVRAVSTFCIPDTSNNAINTTAGLGGTGRLRQNGVNVTNGFTSLP